MPESALSARQHHPATAGRRNVLSKASLHRSLVRGDHVVPSRTTPTPKDRVSSRQIATAATAKPPPLLQRLVTSMGVIVSAKNALRACLVRNNACRNGLALRDNSPLSANG